MLVKIHQLIALLALLLFIIRVYGRFRSVDKLLALGAKLKKLNMLLAVLLLLSGGTMVALFGYWQSPWVYLKLALLMLLVYASIALFSKPLSDTGFRLGVIFALGLWFLTFYAASAKPLFGG